MIGSWVGFLPCPALRQLGHDILSPSAASFMAFIGASTPCPAGPAHAVFSSFLLPCCFNLSKLGKPFQNHYLQLSRCLHVAVNRSVLREAPKSSRHHHHPDVCWASSLKSAMQPSQVTHETTLSSITKFLTACMSRHANVACMQGWPAVQLDDDTSLNNEQ